MSLNMYHPRQILADDHRAGNDYGLTFKNFLST